MAKAPLNVDSADDISVENGRILNAPVKSKENPLEALLAGITPANTHEKVDFGRAVGKELTQAK